MRINWWPVRNEELAEFDVAGALAEISSGLGLESDGQDNNDTDVNLDGADTAAGGGSDDTAATGGAAAKEGEAGEAGAAPTAGKEAAPAPVKQEVTADVLPKTWKPEMAEEWAKASPALRAEVARREEEMFKGLEGYKVDAGFGRTIQKVLEPYVPILEQHGINPIQQIGDLMNAHKTLALGTPEAKLGMLKWLATEYSIDLGKLGAAAPGAAPVEGYVDPAVQALQKQTEALQSRLEQSEAARQQEVKDKATNEVMAFKADPKNIYFDEVAGQVAQLIRSGVCTSLQQAYEQAIYLNPVTRDKEIARLAAEREKAQKEADAKKAAEAKKATGANVRTTAKKGSAAATVGSIDDTLNSAYDNIVSRDQ
jgi:hypothetical protein